MTDDEMMTAEQWAQRNARPIRSPRAAQAGREAADKAVIDCAVGSVHRAYRSCQ